LGAFELACEELLDLVKTIEDRTEDLPDLARLSERTHRRFHPRRIARREFGIPNSELGMPLVRLDARCKIRDARSANFGILSRT
jgi:hypothetical protein